MITHIVSDWLFSPCCVEHQDEFIFERVAVAYSRDYNEVGRAQIKQIKVNPGSSYEQTIMGRSPQCYILSFMEIGPLVQEKIFEGFLPYMGMTAILVM